MFIVSSEVRWSFSSTGIAIDTLIINVKFTTDVVGPLFRLVCHAKFLQRVEAKVKTLLVGYNRLKGLLCVLFFR